MHANDLARARRRATVGRIRRLGSFRGPNRVLYLTTAAFFLSFVVWFNFAPFSVAIGDDLGLTPGQLATLGLCNLALTIPARLLVGKLLDRFGPRRLYGGLLIAAFVPNTVFATANSFPVMVWSRLALGVVGAGFVVGIRMVSEWFDRDEIGTAEGVYGGWGNFGSAGAALALPVLATAVASGPGAWRWGIGISGAVAAVYGAVYLFVVQDTPAGSVYERPRRTAALEVTSRSAVVGLALLQVPIVAALGLVASRIEQAGVIDRTTLVAISGALVVFGVYLVARVVQVNRPALAGAHPPGERYRFRSVVILSLAYAVTFGAELAVISLLPTLFARTFGLEITAAGAAGSAFAFTNLVTRPGGGLLSDVARSRRGTLVWLLAGVVVSFAVLTQLSSSWPLAVGIAVVIAASVFVQAGNGAVFAMVPLIKRRVGGQISGIAGSYGNIGGVVFASVLFFTVDPAHPEGNTVLLFSVIAAVAAIVMVLCRWLPEPEVEATGSMQSPVEIPLGVSVAVTADPLHPSDDGAVAAAAGGAAR
jgi:MFS transporter, NNP family, nitrate/nitrite transporter